MALTAPHLEQVSLGALTAQSLEQVSLGGTDCCPAKGLKCSQASIGQESIKPACESMIRTRGLEGASCHLQK